MILMVGWFGEGPPWNAGTSVGGAGARRVGREAVDEPLLVDKLELDPNALCEVTKCGRGGAYVWWIWKWGSCGVEALEDDEGGVAQWVAG